MTGMIEGKSRIHRRQIPLLLLGAFAISSNACSPRTSHVGDLTQSAQALTAGVSLSPSTATVSLWQTQSFVPAGGTPPYTYAVSGGGTIDAGGNFVAPGLPGTSTVTVSDAGGLVSTAQIQVTMGAHAFPNDTYFSQLWPFTESLTDLGFTAAWASAHDCTSIPIGIVDSGIDPNHPDLAANLSTTLGGNFVNSGGSTSDITYHGTHVAGIVGAVGDNGIGVTGVCWTATLVPLVAVDSTGAYQASAAIAAINYAAQNGIKIVLLSWEDESWQDTTPAGDQGLFSQALQTAAQAGILVIASAGDGDDPTANYAGGDIDQASDQVYPGSLAQANANLLTVAAVTQQDELAAYSNYGPSSVQLAAPGDSIGSTLPSYSTSTMATLGLPQNYGLLSGSAMAAAYVAGAAALTWATHPSLTAATLKTRILGKADLLPGLNQTIEQGRRLNVGHLVLDP